MTEDTVQNPLKRIGLFLGWKGSFTFDRSEPDGMPRKVMDVSRLRALGWSAKTPLAAGLEAAYEWYVRNAAPKAVLQK